MSDDIFFRIREVANGSPKSTEIADTIRSVRGALSDEKAWRISFEETAVNPLIDTAEAMRAQDEIAKSVLKEKRLEAALAILVSKLAEVAEAERQSALVPVYVKAKRERETLWREFCKKYPEHVDGIVGLLARMRAMDEAHEEIEAPAGQERLSTFLSELTGRFVDLLRLPDVETNDLFWGRDPSIQQSLAEMAAGPRRLGVWP